jgi:hypothetical protein
MNKNKLILIAVAAVLVIALTVLLVIALGDLKDRQNDVPQPTTVPSVQAQEGKDLDVNTPYGKMVFPGKWANYLKIQRTENPELKISFSADFPSGKNQPLFDIRFAEAQKPAVGQVVTAEGVAVGVHVTVHTFSPDGSWSVDEIDATNEMLESLNDVLAGLNMVPVGTPIPEIVGEEMSVDTPYCKLYLPKRWLEELRITTDEAKGYYEVIFSAKIGAHDSVEVFAISFGADESYGPQAGLVKTENDIPIVIRLRSFDLDTKDWGSVDRSTLLALQEDVNVLLAKLPQDE